MRKPDWDLIAYLFMWTVTVVSIFVWMLTP